jgi:quercetin dioxygenase-like cupin family protein
MEVAVYRQLESLEHAIKRDLAPVECPVKHHFSKGVYARELFIPAGTVLTGEIHKHENLNIMSQGDMSVRMDDGSVVRVHAPFTIVSPPGTKRAAYAHTDCVWTTIHGTDERDVDKIKQEFIATSYEQYLSHCEQLKLGDKA